MLTLYCPGYSAYAPNPLSSYSALPQLSPPSYHQYSPGLGYTVDTMNTTAGQQQSIT